MLDPQFISRMAWAMLALGFTTAIALSVLALATYLVSDAILEAYEKYLQIKRRNGERR
jgi:hypothetical protein